jgi:DNA end-binding protein Ku
VPDLDALDAPEAGSTFWSGTITFGLVSVPVSLLAAHRPRRVSLRMVSPQGRPLARRYFTARDGKPLRWEQIVRGYEVEPDRFVEVSDEELERLAPERTRDIDLRVFVPAEQIDPKYFDRAYFLVPSGGSTKAYRLLAKVMEETGRAGIATFVMRAREYLVAILAENGILRAETLRFADELRTPDDVGLPGPTEPPAAEVKKIERAIGKRSKSRFDPGELKDAEAERLLRLVRRKLRAGRDVVEVEETEEEGDGGDVIDLMEMLQRSLAGDGSRRSGRRETGSDGRSSPDPLERATKSEIYERARELDIPGRSGMSKDELIEAIRRSA